MEIQPIKSFYHWKVDALKFQIEKQTRDYCVTAHELTNQDYSGTLPYAAHLCHVRDVAQRFNYLIRTEEEFIYSACWAHDVIEDARITYSDLAKNTNILIADIAYAVTLPKGRNRDERNSPEYYKGIRQQRHATFVKLCDRIANVEHSYYSKSSMLGKYKKENAKFRIELFDSEYEDMFNHLDAIFELPKPTL